MTEEWAGSRRGDRKFTVTVARPSDCKRVLSIRIPREELEREKTLILAELRRDLKVPGFRKGKVPARYIEKNYAEVIHGDAVRNLLPAVYEEALARENMAPVGDPSFDNIETDKGDEVTFDVTVEVRPEVAVKGYDGLKVSVAKTQVDDARVEEALDHLRDRMTTLRVVDRPIKPEDVVVIDYGPLQDDGTVDQKRLATNYPVDLGGSSLMPEFKEGLLRMETGETKMIRVRYPDDFPEKEMAGTEKAFEVRVKEIKEKVVPELDDAFAKRLDEKLADLAALRAQIREDLVREEERRYEHDVEEAIIDRLIELNPFSVPDAMVANYLSSVVEEDRRRRPQVDDEAQRESEVREHFRDAAVRTIKKYFVLEAVRKQEAVDVDDAEVEAKIEELSKGSPRDPEEVKRYFANPERRRSLKNDMLDRKVLALLKEKASVKTT